MASSDIVSAFAPAFFGLAASRLVDRLVEEGSGAASSAGLTAPVRTFSLLITLSDGPRTVTEIAERLGVTHAAVIKQASPLLEAKFVARTQDPDDRRRMPLRLTAKGARETARVADFMKAAQKAYLAIFDEIGMDVFAAIERFNGALDRTAFDERLSAQMAD